jgi:hypothetical protein
MRRSTPPTGPPALKLSTKSDKTNSDFINENSGRMLKRAFRFRARFNDGLVYEVRTSAAATWRGIDGPIPRRVSNGAERAMPTRGAAAS